MALYIEKTHTEIYGHMPYVMKDMKPEALKKTVI